MQQLLEQFAEAPRPFETEHLPPEIPRGPGVYLLIRHEGRDLPIKVARADENLRAVLAERMASWTEENTWYVYKFTKTADEAFDKECEIWHSNLQLQYEQPHHPVSANARRCPLGCSDAKS